MVGRSVGRSVGLLLGRSVHHNFQKGGSFTPYGALVFDVFIIHYDFVYIHLHLDIHIMSAQMLRHLSSDRSNVIEVYKGQPTSL